MYLCVCVCVCMYICRFVFVYIYIYTHTLFTAIYSFLNEPRAPLPTLNPASSARVDLTVLRVVLKTSLVKS